MSKLRLCCWNVNGYKDSIHERVLALLPQYDILLLTETKRKLQDLEARQFPDDFMVICNPHDPSRYHGVMMLIRKSLTPKDLGVKLNIPTRRETNSNEAADGRIIVASILDSIVIIGSYTPNSGRELKNLEYRTNLWDVAFRKIIDIAATDYHVIVLGDLNVAPEELDVSRPKTMKNSGGFAPEERESYRTVLSPGLTDTFRKINPLVPGYTWVGNNFNRYHGMRLDHIMVTKGLEATVKESKIHPEVLLSDHIPLSTVLEFP